MRKNGLIHACVVLSFLVPACAPADTDVDPPEDAGEEAAGSAPQAIQRTGQTVEISAGVSDEEHCRLPAALLAVFPAGRQVRISRDDGTDTHLALCTVEGESRYGQNQPSSRVQMTAQGLEERLGATTTVSGVTVETLDDAGRVTNKQTVITAAYTGFSQDVREFTDRRWDSQVAYAAPHGRIEIRTAEQVTRIHDNRTGDREAFWVAGYHTSAGAIFDHLHITSADISSVSFPGLATFFLLRVPYAVSFHGFDSSTIADHVLVGGGELPMFRKGVAEVINDALAGTSFTARWDLSDAAYSAYRGADPDNFVNHMTSAGRGLQIEQQKSMRQDEFAPDKVADAVKSVYDCMLDAPDASGTGRGTLASGGTGYTAGPCPRFIAEVKITSNIGAVGVSAAASASCSGPGKTHVDIYRKRIVGGTWERLGGGYQTQLASCATQDDAGFDPVAGIATPATLRVVVRGTADAGGALPVSVTVD